MNLFRCTSYHLVRRCNFFGANLHNGPLKRISSGKEQIASSSYRFIGGYTKPPGEAVSHQYVHPLSQIVLEKLQKSEMASNWLESNGLDTSTLKINNDGTFLLKFPENGKIWCVEF